MKWMKYFSLNERLESAQGGYQDQKVGGSFKFLLYYWNKWLVEFKRSVQGNEAVILPVEEEPIEMYSERLKLSGEFLSKPRNVREFLSKARNKNVLHLHPQCYTGSRLMDIFLQVCSCSWAGNYLIYILRCSLLKPLKSPRVELSGVARLDNNRWPGSSPGLS